ncbi:MAG: carboxypeptidase regulatory-like domain-containing protein, partial [Planctomycetes bacterium]|nr:carboxypeptidase regulatory-like domain-containing protein [Planctomycetota bacterium]
VQDEHGNALLGVYVSAQGERLTDPGARPAGHVHVRTPADGRFELVGLPAGEYTLRAYPLETPSPDPGEPWLPATLEHVATGAQPIQIELARGASIRGRVLDAQGAALFGYVVATVARGGDPVEYAQTDAEGRFALTVPRGSSWTLEVRGAPEGEGFRTVFAQREGVLAGTRDLELRLAR